MQPIKKSIEYEKYFSNELNHLLEAIMSAVMNETPVDEITVECFLMYALESQDCMLYKVTNSFLNSFAIGNIHDTFYTKVNDTLLSGLRPGRTVGYSSELRNFLSKAYDEKEKLKCGLITSDHVLLAILNDTSTYQFKNVFTSKGLTYETLFKKSEGLHKLVEDFNAAPMEQSTQEGRIIVTSLPIDGSNFLEKLQGMFPVIGNATNQTTQFKNQSKSQVNFCKSLTAMAERGEIDSIVGRKNEILMIEKIFARRKCNNCIIVGKSGCGKTALIEGLAKQVYERTAPISLLNHQFFSLNLSELTGGTNMRGMFEDRVNKVFNELKKIKNCVLLIDDAHKLINDKKSDEYGLIELINDHISGNAIKIIITTTEKGYRSITSSNPNILRQFQKITLDPTSEDETFDILKQNKTYYELYHNVLYPENILKDCISLSRRYITDIPLPTSAIDIIDELGAMKKLRLMERGGLSELMQKLNRLKVEKDLLIKKDDIDGANRLDSEIEQCTIEISRTSEMNSVVSAEEKSITVDELYETIAHHTGIPVSKINVSERRLLSGMEKTLNENVIGQEGAVKAICNAIKRSKVGLYPPNRPIGTFMCIGESGCGKTLVAKMLAKEVFGDEKYLVRFDMSEYSDKTAVNKLIGSNYGYVGSENGGLLTEAIKNKKHCVLLIDEIEKSVDEIYNIFLQVLDDGFLTDNQGFKVDFKNTIIIFTSNVGAKRAATERSVGFTSSQSATKEDIIKKELKKKFPPEFINRIDNIVYFNTLSDDNLNEIIKLELRKLNDRLSNLNLAMDYSEEIVKYIFDIIIKEREYGARPIVRAIQREIENKITDFILDNENKTHFNVLFENDQIKIAG